MADIVPSRIHQLSRMRLAGLQGLWLEYYGFTEGRMSFTVMRGTDIESPRGPIRLMPWDRDRYITAIWEHEKHMPQ
jgi:hypothetical protein